MFKAGDPRFHHCKRKVDITGSFVFSHFETRLYGYALSIKVRKYKEDWITCPQIVVYLKGEVLN